MRSTFARDRSGKLGTMAATGQDRSPILACISRDDQQVEIAMKFDLGRDLFDACIAGDLSRLEEVLEKSDPSCLVWRDRDGRTALHTAIEARNV